MGENGVQRGDMIQTRSHTESSRLFYPDHTYRTSPTHSYRSIEDGSGSRDWSPEDGKMSPSRRTFCLFTTFDLILTFILWVIYTQLIGKKGLAAFKDQVYQYNFETSLFDTVMIAAVRFVFILLAYALFRLTHWWVIAITTSMTCIYLLFKCFYFEFNDEFFGGKNPLSYVLLIICFVLAWVETWWLDFKVIPMEKRASRHRGRILPPSSQRTPLLSDDQGSVTSDTREYYSPFHTPEGSDDETEQKNYKSPAGSQNHSRTASTASLYSVQSQGDTEHYLRLVEEASTALWDILHMDGWKAEAGKSLETGTVHSLYIKKYGRKVFRLQGILPLPPKECWSEMIAGLNDSPRWNPTVIESRPLQTIDDTTEVTYNIAAEAAGGVVSARDFVSLRRAAQREGRYLSVATGCTHPDMPAQKKYVRNTIRVSNGLDPDQDQYLGPDLGPYCLKRLSADDKIDPLQEELMICLKLLNFCTWCARWIALQSLDDSTEITYNIAAEAAGGLVSARDFISIRHWYIRKGRYCAAATGCCHQDMPVQKNYVRGENGPGGWSFEEVEGESDKCLYTWIVNSNLKGWIPQAVIDQALSGVLIQYFNLLLNHILETKESR